MYIDGVNVVGITVVVVVVVVVDDEAGTKDFFSLTLFFC
jgi:hypothetical protein